MKKISVIVLVVALLMSGMLPGTSAAGKKKVELAYVEWSCATATANVTKVVLEKLGYKTDILPVSAAAMWQAVSAGDVEGMTCAWLPTTHSHYLAKVKDKLVDLGPNAEGAKVGLVVPTYVTIDSIAQMKDHADKFDGKITGLEPGAGMMTKTERAMKDYKMEGFELMEGSEATMIAEMNNRIRKKEWVVVLGWTPHWKFSRWELKFLEDPIGIYGDVENISTVVRKGLDKDMPEVYNFLDNFKWTLADIALLQQWNSEKGADPYKNAQKWVAENPDKVNAWLK